MRNMTVPLAAVLAGIACLGLLWLFVLAPRLERDAAGGLGRGDYSLTTTAGAPFTQATLEGQPSAVFFGFTHCPDVCPTTLGDLATLQEELGGDTGLRIFFVTVDPERDSADLLRDYVSWVPGTEGVVGEPAQIAAAIKAFGILAERVPTGGDDYTMSHTTSILLFDRSGQFVQTIGYQEPMETALTKLRALIAAG